MFDIGWTELLVIAIVLIVVVGPKDLPPMLRAFGKTTANLRKMAGEFRAQFDEALRESELDDVRRTISDAQRLNPTNALREAINPLRQMGQEIRGDLEKATQVSSRAEPALDAEKTDVEAQQAIAAHLENLVDRAEILESGIFRRAVEIVATARRELDGSEPEPGRRRGLRDRDGTFGNAIEHVVTDLETGRG